MRYRYRIRSDIAIAIASLHYPISLLYSKFHVFLQNSPLSQFHRFTAKPWFHRNSMFLSQVLYLSLFRLSQSLMYKGACPIPLSRRDIAIARQPSDHPAHPTIHIMSQAPYHKSLIANIKAFAPYFPRCDIAIKYHYRIYISPRPLPPPADAILRSNCSRWICPR